MQRILFCLLIISATLSVVKATDYFVANTGNDTNDGLSLSTSFATLQHAADIIQSGDKILVADGTYSGFALSTSGTMTEPILIQAMGSNALINAPGPTTDGINIEHADYVIIDGFIVNDQPRNGIRLALADHCIVRNCRCDNNFERGIFTAFTDDILIENNICTNSIDEHGIYVSNSSDRPIIRYNECFGNNNIGIHMNGDLSQGGDGIISDAQVYGNFLHDNNLAAGINMDGVVDAVVYNNIIVNNHTAQGIALFRGDGAVVSHGAKIYNNTIIVPDDGRWGILLTDGANVNTEIYNNIIISLHSWRGSITAESTTDLSSDYNIVVDRLSNQGDGVSISLSQWQALGLDNHSNLADHLVDIFEDVSMNDYHLLSTSQALDMGLGSLVEDIVTIDFESNNRPNGIEYDIGAYEYQDMATPADIGLTAQDIEFFPNPAEGFLTVKGDFINYEIEVLDINGTIISTHTGSNSPLTIDLSELMSGLYFIRIHNNVNTHLSIVKIIKE